MTADGNYLHHWPPHLPPRSNHSHLESSAGGERTAKLMWVQSQCKHINEMFYYLHFMHLILQLSTPSFKIVSAAHIMRTPYIHTAKIQIQNTKKPLYVEIQTVHVVGDYLILSEPSASSPRLKSVCP